MQTNLKPEHGTVTVGGVVINIMQEPYPDNGCYRSVGMSDAQIAAAGGVDNISLPSDAYYQLYWDIVDPDCDDGADACDWDDVDATLCE